MTDPTKAPAAGVDGLRTIISAVAHQAIEASKGEFASAAIQGVVDAAVAALTATEALPRQDDGVLREADLKLALDCALAILIRHEPGDSRAVSSEFVATAAIAADLNDLDESRAICHAALSASEGEK